MFIGLLYTNEMQFAIRLFLTYGDYLTNMMVQGTGQHRKYDGAGNTSLFGLTNMVVQGTGAPKIWWCRGQVRRKYGGAGDRSAKRSRIWWYRGQVKAAI
jgi:hypothetical protein